jgi:hypothetical protein
MSNNHRAVTSWLLAKTGRFLEEDMIKSLCVIFSFAFLCSFSFAQQTNDTQSQQTVHDKGQDQKKAHEKTQAESARAAAGCGPTEVHFDVKADKKQHPAPQPEADKALVYVFENDDAATTRVGLDGKWMGANRGQSYFFFSVDPGEHRLCTDWQSSFEKLSRLGSAASFTTEIGKTYYFRIEIRAPEHQSFTMKLEPLDSAEGQFLISSNALSTSHVQETEPPEQ